MESLIKPLTPNGNYWECVGRVPRELLFGYEGFYWHFPPRRFFVISALEVVAPERVDLGPEYHVSLTKRDRKDRMLRTTRFEADFVVQAFGLEDADEDNHVPGGIARNFWLPVAEHLRGYVCPCKETEQPIHDKLNDYTWRVAPKGGK